jgi:hypothetical protein
MTTLYICIDESGNHTRDECYVVAGCWCLSSRSDPTNVLTATKDRLLELIEQDPRSTDRSSELKGSAIHPETLNEVVSYLRECMYNERTIEGERSPWAMNIPIGFTLFVSNSELTIAAIEDLVEPHNGSEVIRVSALTTILAPLFGSTHVDLVDCNEVRVLLDAETWLNPAQRVQESIDEASLDADRIRFETCDSVSTPGIQLADIAAYS